MKKIHKYKTTLIAAALLLVSSSVGIAGQAESPLVADKKESETAADTKDPMLDMAVTRCKAIGYKPETDDYRNCVLDQTKQITRLMTALLSNMTKENIKKFEEWSKKAPSEKQVVRVPPRLDLKNSPPTDNYYPPSLRKAEVVGVSTVRVCVDAAGKLKGEPSITNSSGTQGLDDAALMWSKVARFSPGKADGVPTTMCSMFNIRFGFQSDSSPTDVPSGIANRWKETLKR